MVCELLLAGGNQLNTDWTWPSCIGGFLAREGIVVVSGLAFRDVIPAGHQGCLENNGETVAVLAHGLDMV